MLQVAPRSGPVRVLIAAALGTGLTLLWLWIFQLAPRWPVDLVGQECHGDPALCELGDALLGMVVGAVLVLGISMALGALALRALRLPGWVAVAGPVLGLLLAWVGGWVLDHWFDLSRLGLLPAMAAGYALTMVMAVREDG